MAFISAQHLAPAQGFFEPQRTYNWSLEIALDDVGDQLLIMQGLETFEAPKESNEEIVLEYGNERRYVAGKALYETSALTLKDFVDQGVASAIIKWRRLVYNSETGSIGLARDYKKNADLTVIAPDQSSGRVFKLLGIWPQAVEYGAYDMTSSDKILINVTLRYDRMVPGANLTFGLSGLNPGSLTPPI